MNREFTLIFCLLQQNTLRHHPNTTRQIPTDIILKDFLSLRMHTPSLLKQAYQFSTWAILGSSSSYGYRGNERWWGCVLRRTDIPLWGKSADEVTERSLCTERLFFSYKGREATSSHQRISGWFEESKFTPSNGSVLICTSQVSESSFSTSALTLT